MARRFQIHNLLLAVFQEDPMELLKDGHYFTAYQIETIHNQYTKLITSDKSIVVWTEHGIIPNGFKKLYKSSNYKNCIRVIKK